MPTLTSPDPGERALARSAAHELNNIAAALLGFIELASIGNTQDELFAELRIVVRRMCGLAEQLESLADEGATPAAHALADCLTAPPASEFSSGTHDGERIDTYWDCDPTSKVRADPARIRRAARALADFVASEDGNDRPSYRVEANTPAMDRCRACGAPLTAEAVRIAVTSGSAQALLQGDERAWQLRGASMAALNLRALAHLVHAGGGHLGYEPSTGTIGIVLIRAAGTPI
ncbi:MAG TPA: hypothetical protein VMU86_08295 [Steroidobacteraceae bacterium]|nr:hypothetical protein [Steroidobacteraceae bacterium]